MAGTQVVVAVEEEDAAGLDAGQRLSGGGVATGRRLAYRTRGIEGLVEGGHIVGREQRDPAGALVRCRIGRTYIRRAWHLQVLMVRDADGREQTIRVTDEHPIDLRTLNEDFQKLAKAQGLPVGRKHDGLVGERHEKRGRGGAGVGA